MDSSQKILDSGFFAKRILDTGFFAKRILDSFGFFAKYSWKRILRFWILHFAARLHIILQI
jgi:hypothetical protein